MTPLSALRILIPIFVMALPPVAISMEINLPDVHDPVLVSLPENHDPEKSWPAVFSYHGFNGSPNTRITRTHTGKHDWIVVGMPYVQRGRYQLTDDDLNDELRAFRQVRDQLVQSHGLDPKRIVVTGYSKGGWMTDAILQAEPSLLGGAILMGGHIPSSPDPPTAVKKDRAVFIGVGRRDPNYLPSLKAMVFYRAKGAATTFEAWPELGHDFPRKGSAALREWYELRNDRIPDQQALEIEFTEHTALPPVEAWHALNRFKERPFTNTADSPWPGKISAEITRLEKTPEVAREAHLLKAHRNLLGRELKLRTLKELQAINGGYMKLLGDAAESPQLDDIRLDHRRILAVLKQAEQTPATRPRPQRPEPTPEPPSGNPTIPSNPMVR